MASGGPGMALFLLGYGLGPNHRPLSGEGPRPRPLRGQEEHQEKPLPATVALGQLFRELGWDGGPSSSLRP